LDFFRKAINCLGVDPKAAAASASVNIASPSSPRRLRVGGSSFSGRHTRSGPGSEDGVVVMAWPGM
jgi:hypothetical protein